jgi:hypothetical protein
MSGRRDFWLVCGGAAAGLTFFILSAEAEPMRCADLKATCVAGCAKVAAGIRGACLSNCNTRQTHCQQSGCWNDGARNFCGLLRR